MKMHVWGGGGGGGGCYVGEFPECTSLTARARAQGSRLRVLDSRAQAP